MNIHEPMLEFILFIYFFVSGTEFRAGKRVEIKVMKLWECINLSLHSIEQCSLSFESDWKDTKIKLKYWEKHRKLINWINEIVLDDGPRWSYYYYQLSNQISPEKINEFWFKNRHLLEFNAMTLRGCSEGEFGNLIKNKFLLSAVNVIYQIAPEIQSDESSSVRLHFWLREKSEGLTIPLGKKPASILHCSTTNCLFIHLLNDYSRSPVREFALNVWVNFCLLNSLHKQGAIMIYGIKNIIQKSSENDNTSMEGSRDSFVIFRFQSFSFFFFLFIFANFYKHKQIKPTA